MVNLIKVQKLNQIRSGNKIHERKTTGVKKYRKRKRIRIIFFKNVPDFRSFQIIPNTFATLIAKSIYQKP